NRAPGAPFAAIRAGIWRLRETLELRIALPSPAPLSARRWRGGLRRGFSSGLHRVPFELTREAELAQFVPYHVFGDVHRNKFLSVVHGNRVSHHLRMDGRAP